MSLNLTVRKNVRRDISCLKVTKPRLSCSKKKPQKIKVIEHVLADVEDEFNWTQENEFVGIKVAKYYGKGKKRKWYSGVVTKYAPPSNDCKKDQLYHICFEDEDESDWEEDAFQFGAALGAIYSYEKMYL